MHFQPVNIFILERTCPGTFDHDPIKHLCHKFMNLPLAFADAVSYCKTLGAHLLVVDNQEEDTYIVNKLGGIAGKIYKQTLWSTNQTVWNRKNLFRASEQFNLTDTS